MQPDSNSQNQTNDPFNLPPAPTPAVPTVPADEGFAPAEPIADPFAPITADPVPSTPAPAAPVPPMPTPSPSTSGDPLAELASLKQKALGELQPLISHLNQAPEEAFKTTMMMVQSTDNHLLLEEALGYAKAITDEKKRAQALLDVVNEANYFTQHVYKKQ